MRDQLNRYLKSLEQKNRKLTPLEKYSIRLGWFATSLIMLSPHVINSNPELGYTTYIIGGILALPQVLVAKQWNLVLLNINVTIAYFILYTNLN